MTEEFIFGSGLLARHRRGITCALCGRALDPCLCPSLRVTNAYFRIHKHWEAVTVEAVHVCAYEYY